MIDLIRRISEIAYRPAPGIVGAMTISVSVLIGLGGCAQAGREKALDEVATSIRSADANVTDISVERTKDGFASVLAVNVAIKEETVDVARLSSLLSAVVNAPGTSDFTLLHFAVWSPRLNGELLDLRPSAKQLGVTAMDEAISEDVAGLKEAAGDR